MNKIIKYMLVQVMVVLCIFQMLINKDVEAASDTWLNDAYSSKTWYTDAAEGVGNSENNPYILTSAEDIAGLLGLVNNDGIEFENKYLKLQCALGATSIDLSAHEWVPIGSGSNNKYFKGNIIFNTSSSNVTLQGINIGSEGTPYTSSYDVGMFAKIGDTSSIKELYAEVTIYSNDSKNIGGLVGVNNGLIYGGSSKTKIVSNKDIASSVVNIGGIAGYNNGKILRSSLSDIFYVTTKQYDEVYVGGIVGENYGEASYNNITFNESINYKDGEVFIAGLVAKNFGNVTNSFLTGNINATASNTNDGDRYVCPLISYNRGHSYNCYYKGNINVTDSSTNMYVTSYPFETNDNMIPAFYISDASTILLNGKNKENSNYQIRTNIFNDKSDSYLKSQDFVDELNANIQSQKDYGYVKDGIKWAISPYLNNGYPMLFDDASMVYTSSDDVWSKYYDIGWANGITRKGTGTEVDPYLIEDADDLAALAYCFNVRNYKDIIKYNYYKIVNDIDLKAHRWIPIGMSNFNGCLDGDGHSLSNVMMKVEEEYVLLEFYGFIARNLGIVKNINIELNVEDYAENGYLGCFIGANDGGTVRNVSAKTKMKAKTFFSSAFIEATYKFSQDDDITALESYVDKCSVIYEAEIMEEAWFGGLILDCGNSSVTNCYSNGTVIAKGECEIGGLINWADSYYYQSELHNNYAVLNIYWKEFDPNYLEYVNTFIGSSGEYINMSNNYYTTNTIYEYDNIIHTDNALKSMLNEDYPISTIQLIPVTKEYMKDKDGDIISKLNSVVPGLYEEDINNINDGYPVLASNRNQKVKAGGILDELNFRKLSVNITRDGLNLKANVENNNGTPEYRWYKLDSVTNNYILITGENNSIYNMETPYNNYMVMVIDDGRFETATYIDCPEISEIKADNGTYIKDEQISFSVKFNENVKIKRPAAKTNGHVEISMVSPSNSKRITYNQTAESIDVNAGDVVTFKYLVITEDRTNKIVLGKEIFFTDLEIVNERGAKLNIEKIPDLIGNVSIINVQDVLEEINKEINFTNVYTILKNESSNKKRKLLDFEDSTNILTSKYDLLSEDEMKKISQNLLTYYDEFRTVNELLKVIDSEIDKLKVEKTLDTTYQNINTIVYDDTATKEIENLKFTYERLRDKVKSRVSKEYVTKLNTLYAKAIEEIGYKNITDDDNTEIVGLINNIKKNEINSKLQISGQDVTSSKKIEVKNEVNQEIDKVLDIKILEDIGGTLSETQPIEDKTVLVKIKIPKEYKTRNPILHHIPEGAKISDETKVSNQWVYYNDICGYIYFEAEHFSIYAITVNKESKPSNPSSGGSSSSSSGGSSGGSSSSSTSVKVSSTSDVTPSHNAYMRGYNDGTFKPNDKIQRGEIASVFANISPNFNMYQQYELKFNDVLETYWAKNYIGFCAKMNILTGYDKNTFKAGKNMTKAEFISALVRYKGITAKGTKSKFKDVQGRWFEKYSVALEELGILKGKSDTQLGADDSITRAEVCTLINAVLNRKPDKEKIKNLKDIKTFKDVNKNSWYYADVVEATNLHKVALYH